MKNSTLKGAFGALALVGGLMAAKKIKERKRFMKGIFEEYGVKERTPFGFADTIREMDDEKYAELKAKMKKEFSKGRCGRQCNQEKTEA